MEHSLRLLNERYYKILKTNVANDKYQVIKQFEVQSAHYQNLSQWCEQFVSTGRIYQEDVDKFRAFFHHLQPNKIICYRRKVNNAWRWVFLETFPGVPEQDGANVVYIYIRDFHTPLEKHHKLEYQTSHDQLTGLANRNAYEDYLAAATKPVHHSVVFADLNKLKQYNDTYGHSAGDTYLQIFAHCLCAIFHLESCYRIGGDEFVIIVPNVDYIVLQDKIIRLFHLLQENNVSCAIGCSCAQTTNPQELRDLIRDAETKMYQNKKSSRK